MTIQEIILSVAQKKRVFQASDVLHKLNGQFTRRYVSLVLARMTQSQQLVRTGSRRYTYYALPRNIRALQDTITRRLKNDPALREHEVLFDMLEKATFLQRLPENIESIFSYAFSEMLNNAIEHSQSPNIEVSVQLQNGTLEFVVSDTGIGVFNSIISKFHLASPLEAIQDLLKGKTTTDPKAHSGEGIFFTSKIADVFVLDSFSHRLRVDNRLPDIFIELISPQKRGTRITFTINKDSQKHLSNLFKQYESTPGEYDFDKTEIKVRLYTLGTIYVSRSQARRVLSGLEKFKVVILDFDRVPTIGQAFADEIFRVFSGRHPSIEIQPINMNEAVEFMVGRVEKP